jgi:hypothetical protein
MLRTAANDLHYSTALTKMPHDAIFSRIDTYIPLQKDDIGRVYLHLQTDRGDDCDLMWTSIFFSQVSSYSRFSIG